MTDEEEFRPVVQLLLARMKSSPDEFMIGDGKYRAWTDILESVQVHATEAELVALRKALSDIRMEELHHRAMAVLLRDKASNDANEARFKTTERYSAGYASPLGLFGSAAQTEMDVKLQESIIKRQNEAMDAYRRQNNTNIRQIIKDGVERVFNK